MTMDALEAKLVDFALGDAVDTLPADAVRAAKLRVLDSIAVGMAAYLSPPARIARRLAPSVSQGLTATIWGEGRRTTPEMAAFANGVMVRYLDLNDAYRTTDAHHPSDYLPGLIGLAEALGRSGAETIAALAVAYEIMCRFTDAVPWNAAGWDQPLSGAMATALAAARLLNLSSDGARDALALAALAHLPTYQTRAGELSMWKGCAGPNGARNGIFAALLAADGMTGPMSTFDGVFGLWNQTLGEPRDVDLAAPGTKRPWGLVETNIKTYPVRDSCQLPINTALDLRQKLGPQPIRQLTITTYKSAWEGAVKDPELWAPKTRETADHSMLFSVAAALLDGRVTADSFETGRFRDADILKLIGKTDVVVSDEYTGATPEVRNCLIEAQLEDGSAVSAHRALTLAEIAKGMSDDEVRAKFDHCTARAFSAQRREDIWRYGMAMDELTRLDPLIASTRL